jgi:hypothetical protein
MRLTSALLALPLLAAAAPTNRLIIQNELATEIPGVDTGETALGWDMDLQELRLVQFGEDEAPM